MTTKTLVGALVVVLSAIGIARSSETQDTFAMVESAVNAAWLVDVDRAGNVVGSLSLPKRTSDAVSGITPGLGDGSVLVSMGTFFGSGRILRVTRTGYSVIATLANNITDIEYDDAGEIVGLMNRPVTGLYRLSGGTPTLLAKLPDLSVADFTVDRATGDWIVLATNPAGALWRVDRATSAITTIGTLAFPSGEIRYDLDSNTIFSGGAQILSFDVQSARSTTLTSLAFTGAVLSIAFDPTTRGILFQGFYVPPRAVVYGAVERDGTQIGVVSTPRVVTPWGVCAREGRPFVPLSAPSRGSTYRVRFGVPAEANRDFVAALSFSHTPGIDAPVGKIPLGFDLLFGASLAGAFRGMAGKLDARGEATMEIDLPPIPALENLPIHLAAITLQNQKIEWIYGPHTFVIR